MDKRESLSNTSQMTKELFGRVAGSGFNVDLHTFGHEWLIYAQGYKIAADTVIQNLHSSGKQFVVFPVGFLYHQYLELMIKGLTRQAKDVLRDRGGYARHHILPELWKECRPLLEKTMPRYSKEGLDETEKCVLAFAIFDFNGEYFRYPEDKPHVPWNQSVEDLNLHRMHTVISAVGDRLDCFYYEMNSRLERRAEAASNEYVREYR
jgi:hypothetical protein